MGLRRRDAGADHRHPARDAEPVHSRYAAGGTATLGIAPSGKPPIPFTGPTADGTPRYVDPANGRIVVPAMGPYATGKRPWLYQN